jgi:hypothetical protein
VIRRVPVRPAPWPEAGERGLLPLAKGMPRPRQASRAYREARGPGRQGWSRPRRP